MKTILLFPPTWHPSQPYLSLPSLTGFLKQAGITDVVQRDLGIEVLDGLLSPETGRDMYERMQDKIKTLDLQGTRGETGPSSQEHLARMKEALDWFPPLYDQIGDAKAALRSEQFYDLDRYRESLFLIDRWLAFISTLYFPTRISVVDNQWRHSIYSSRDILKAVADEEENPYLEIFRSRFVPEILAQAPGLVGVSITATSQILPGLTLCRLLKQANPDLHVTIGGSIFTRLVDNLRRTDAMFQFADDFVVFEGETALLELIHQLEGRREFSKVPNLIYRQNGKIVVNQPFYSENINALAAPDFDGMPFRQYFAPQAVLPIQFSRGCYYKDCAFCALTLDHQNFRQRRPEKVVEDLKLLMAKYRTPFFFFTDECFALSPTKRLCTQLIQAGVNAQWTCEMRFEKNLTRDLLKLMRDAGCLKIVCGLESYNQRVMDFMKKGIKREHVNRIVEDCLDLDVAVHCYVLIGFPTETAAEAMDTLNFVLDHKRLNSSYGFSCQPCLFDLEKEAPIMSDPASYGIRRIMRPASEDLSLGYFYEVQEGMSPDEAERVYQQVYEKISDVVCELPFNYSMADGLLYIARAKAHAVTAG